MKRLVVVLLVAMLLVSNIMVASIFAEGNAAVEISAADVTANKGETVTVALNIDKNDGFIGLNLYFTYPEELTLTKVKNANATLTMAFDKTAVWDAASMFTGTGKLAELQFTVSENAEPGAVYEIQVHFIEAYDEDLNDVAVATYSGKITVVCGHANKVMVQEKASTCVVQGNNQYYTCSECGKVLKADGVTGTTVEAEALPLAGHTGGTATCEEQAVCSVCSQPYGEFAEHTFREAPAKASDCVTHGNHLYYICTVCDEAFKADKVTKTTADAEKLPLADHTGGTATCEKQAVCSVCFTPYGEFAEHTFCEVPAKASDCVNHGNHLYYTCAVCDEAFKADKVTKTTADAEKLPLADHTGGTATCEKQAVCSVCSTPYGELAAHSLKEVAEKESDCVTQGNNKYYVCTVCDQAFKADKVTETTAEAEKLPLTGHTGGTATCEKQAVCSVCSAPYGELAAHSLKEVAEKESDCVTQGNNKYYVCTVCDRAFKEDKVTETTEEAEKLPLTGHTGGTATCKELAVCSVCSKPYGELAAHTCKKVDAKEETHTESGNIEYYVCRVCDKLFKDEAGIQQIQEADTVVPAAGHNYGEYSKDEKSHWQVCSCGTETEKENHTLGNWQIIQDSTEEKLGLQERSCSVCGYTESKEIPLKPHTMKKVDAKEATHTDKGNIAYYVCTGCGKLYEDIEGQKPIAEADTVIPAIGHAYGEYSKDESGHWQNCSCGVKTDTEAHTYGQWEIVEEATKIKTGLRKRICGICGYEDLEEIPMVPCEHENAELVGKKEATCAVVGYTGDLYCAECEKTVRKGETIKKLDHTFEDGVCTVCGADQSSPATGDAVIAPVVMLMVLSGAVLLYLMALKKKRVA